MMFHHKRGSKAGIRHCGIFLLLILVTATAEANFRLGEAIPYYGRELYENLRSRSSHPDLKDQLHIVLSKVHVAVAGDFDLIKPECDPNEDCYQHEYHNYKNARAYMFGYVHLQSDSQDYWLTSIYCQEVFAKSSFPRGRPPGPMQIPNHHVINAEHIWPQSHFSKSEPKRLQKSDLHALYPATVRANSSRNNHAFGEVDEVKHSPCPGAYKGYIQGHGSRFFFEPPDNMKGNVARAVFYFSTRYDLEVDEIQEEFLRGWHRLDPVDDEEKQRHELIFEVQKSRNPFIDHPELVDLIEDF